MQNELHQYLAKRMPAATEAEIIEAANNLMGVFRILHKLKKEHTNNAK
ncbi:hypothetical protein [Parelusimicrobium proximum]